jgi:hypothetical protein
MKTQTRLGLFVLSFLILLFPLFIACHSEPVAPQEPRILIINPPAESTTTDNSITIDTFVERFELVGKVGQSNSPGEGHIIFYMDVAPPIELGQSTLTADGTYAISTEKSYTWNSVQPGRHVFWVQLVNNDNTPLQPPEAVRVYVTVKEE